MIEYIEIESDELDPEEFYYEICSKINSGETISQFINSNPDLTQEFSFDLYRIFRNKRIKTDEGYINTLTISECSKILESFCVNIIRFHS